MNITDFVNSIKLQLSDLEKVSELGYIQGISKLQKLMEEQGKTGGYKKRRGKTLRKKKNRRKTKRIRWR